MRSKTIWTKAIVVVALLALGCGGLFSCGGDKAVDDGQSSAATEVTQGVLDQQPVDAATVEELRAFLVSSVRDSSLKEAFAVAEVTAYPPVYVLTATMPTGALITADVLIKDDTGIQRLFGFNVADASTEEKISSCIQHSAKEITVITKYTGHRASSEEDLVYSFVKKNGKWRQVKNAS
ncbi:MAG: hypothetical protein FWG24_03965 [Eggerthellaceae bacterium]|nr:hypothetical protein [Eggerthellaceae bacterium]